MKPLELGLGASMFDNRQQRMGFRQFGKDLRK
jgi:hypothetical protein